MTYGTTAVANSILRRSFDADDFISPMKLQRVLYFSAAYYARQTQRPLLSESFQVWQYGPVNTTIYDKFKPFGSDVIDVYAKDAKGKGYVADEDADPVLRNVLDSVWRGVSHLDAVSLSRLTHVPDSAWHKAFRASRSYLLDEDVRNDTTYFSMLGL